MGTPEEETRAPKKWHEQMPDVMDRIHEVLKTEFNLDDDIEPHSIGFKRRGETRDETGPDVICDRDGCH